MQLACFKTKRVLVGTAKDARGRPRKALEIEGGFHLPPSQNL